MDYQVVTRSPRLSLAAPDMKMGRVTINAAYVNERLKEVTEDEDLTRFIL